MLEDEIGSGSFGVVWKGQWRNTEVAVKQMRGQMSEKQLSAFLQEAGLLGKLRPHNNVMLFLGVCTQPYPCIVTELLSGGSLFDLLVKGDLPLDKKLKLAMDICSGMAHLHSENVIHRDLATRNVLLNETGIAKIADFGMSRVLEGNSSNGGAQTLSAIGPVKWMSPEALNERKYSVYSDVWSFGVLLWEMWARKEPFANLDATQAAIKIARDNLTLSRPDRCPDAVWIVMGNCWAVTKEDRPTFTTLFKQFSNLSRENATSPSRYVQY
jgi:serine/threonine protein kinase